MGEVWLASDNLLEERVALKFIKPALFSSSELVTLLRQECRNARRLSHPNIVRVFDFHSAAPWYFLSMEYVEGCDIGQISGQSYKRILFTLLPVIEALGYAHRLGLAHLDLKVNNILIDSTGQARLTDFGISAIMRTNEAFSGGGTPYALSPQLLRRQAPTKADDIYALGVLLYELLTGLPPFPLHFTADRILVEPPPRMKCAAALPAELETLVMRMLAKTAQERPSSMNEIGDVLGKLVSTRTQATIPPTINSEPTIAAPPTFSPPRPDTISETVEYAKQSMIAGKGGRIAAVVAAFALLITLAASVFYYLPLRVQEAHLASGTARQPETSDVSRSPAPSLTQTENQQPWEQAKLERTRQEADDMALSLLEKQTQLQSLNVQRWSKEAFDTAVAEARNGDDLFVQGSLQEAIGAYKKATAMMNGLIAESHTLLQDALNQGRQALAARDSEQAIAAFETALLLDPDHEEAASKLKRARQMPQVKALFESAAQYEQQGNLTQSRSKYREAAELDPEFQAVRAALARIEEKIEKSRFSDYMTEGLSALERNDFVTARKAFENARSLAPSSQAPLEGLSRLTSKLHLKQIDEHRQAAVTLETQERWREAESHYQAALKLDATLVFAKQGKARAARRASLSEALQFHVQHPQRLAAENVLAEAIRQRDQALAINTPGPKLRTQIEKLSDAIDRATTPVRVRLESDNKTQVVMYKVGRLGSFASKDLNLRPGSYTIVGMRDGYRDVRLQVNVVAGRPPPPVQVRCEEKI